MHHALQVEDIVYAVLEHFESFADLVNVAKTCKTLSGPALNMLWSEQISIIPLMKCLPEDTWEVGEDQAINFSREPTPAEWKRLKVNASRVRQLYDFDYSAGLPHLSLSALQRLFKQFPPAKLFPNLCTLEFSAIFRLPECSSKFLLLRQFMLPTLKALKFSVFGGVSAYEEMEQLLCALPAEAYHLRRLSVTAANHCPIPFTVPPSFGKLLKLNTLSIHGVDVGMTRQTITNIQQARCLQVLVLTLCKTSYDAGGIPLELHSLEELHLYGNSLPQCTHFLLQITTRQLSNICIVYSEPACPTEIAAVMESLSASCQTFESLKRIYMMDISYQSADNHKLVIPLPSEIFRPLLKFSELSCVKFIGIGNYNLDDSFISDVAVSWPSIQELKFASKRRASCTVTFAAMMSLVSRCKSLQVLHLTVNATRPTITPRSANGRKVLWPKQTALRKLRLGYSEVSKVARVPYFLAKVFPTLSDFKWYVDFGDSNIDIAMKSALAEARRQLRMLRNLADDETGEELEVDSDEDKSEW